MFDANQASRGSAKALRFVSEGLPDDYGYWSTVTDQVLSDCLATDPTVFAEGFAQIMMSDAGHQASLLESPSTPALVRVPYSRLRSWGDPDDIESPVGFYSLQSAWPQPDPDHFLVHAPCMMEPLSRLRHGPEVATLYALARKPGLDVAAYYASAAKRFSTSGLGRSLPGGRASTRLARAVTKFKQALSIWVPLPNSQRFYEEGIRFYEHPGRHTSFTSSSTPGILLPEEYYGSVYFPGITKVVPPGELQTAYRDRNPPSFTHQAYESWRYLLREQLFNHPEDALAKNPFRLAYFELGLREAVRANYFILTDSAGIAIRSAMQKWEEAGLGEHYEQDAVEVVCANIGSADRPSVRCLRGSDPDLNFGLDLRRLTLLSSAFTLISERDPKAEEDTSRLSC